jgi:nucleotide-binding universal stress UspA family protein
MSKVILLAVDARHYAPESVVQARELAGDTGDKIIVLHVHEFAIGRFGRLQVDCPEGEADRLVTEILADLRNAGVAADAEIRETQLGHIARVILEAADEHNARVIVLGSSGRTDLPFLPFGSVSNRLLHLARRPVMVVPGRLAAEKATEIRAAAGHATPETIPG